MARLGKFMVDMGVLRPGIEPEMRRELDATCWASQGIALESMILEGSTRIRLLVIYLFLKIAIFPIMHWDEG